MSDEAGFHFVDGRYYHSMWYLELPTLPGAQEGCSRGGNVTTLVWRHDEEPAVWHFQYRFRYYRDPDPDEMCWYEVVIRNKPIEAVAALEEVRIQFAASARLSRALDRGEDITADIKKANVIR